MFHRWDTVFILECSVTLSPNITHNILFKSGSSTLVSFVHRTVLQKTCGLSTWPQEICQYTEMFLSQSNCFMHPTVPYTFLFSVLLMVDSKTLISWTLITSRKGRVTEVFNVLLSYTVCLVESKLFPSKEISVQISFPSWWPSRTFLLSLSHIKISKTGYFSTIKKWICLYLSHLFNYVESVSGHAMKIFI